MKYMPKDNLTIFQKLGRTLSGVANNTSPAANSYNIHNVSSNNPVIDTAKTKEEYDKKLLQHRQDKLLGNQWFKAQVDINNYSLAGLNDVKLMYRDTDLMDCWPEIGAALDIYAEETTFGGEDGNVINISSNSNRIKGILDDLFINRLSINTMLPMICRCMCKYGNEFMLLNTRLNDGILGWRQLPVYEIERYENGMRYPYMTVNNGFNSNKEQVADETKFVWVSQSQSLAYRNWQVAHFRLLYDSQMLPYGVSILNKARRHFRILSMMEDSMLIYRLDRSMERRIFKINVGAIDDQDVPQYVQEIANNFKRTPIIDPQTGQLDLRKNIMPVWRKTPIPLLDGRTITIEELAKEYEEGKENYVYSIQDKTLEVVPGKVVWCGKTRTADEMVKITLDDDTYVVMAPEHEVVMRDGTKKRADKLVSGESIMPFYIENKLMENSKSDYQTVYNPNSGKYEFTHRLVAKELPKQKGETVVHHKNIRNLNNRFDNTPNNLQWMTWKDHMELHRTFNSENQLSVVSSYLRNAWKENPNRGIDKMVTIFDEYTWNEIENAIVNSKIYNRKTMMDFINHNLIDHLVNVNESKKLCNNRSISRGVIQSNVQRLGFKTITEYLDNIRKKNNMSDMATLRKQRCSELAYKTGFNNYYNWTDEQKRAATHRHIVNKDYHQYKLEFDNYVWTEIRNNILNGNIRIKDDIVDFVNNNLADYISKKTNAQYFLRTKKISNSVLYRIVKEKYDMSVGQFIMSMKKNHKVKLVEYVSGDDVYCMTVKGLNGEDDRHNFAIRTITVNNEWCKNGCFVANCNTDDFFIPVRPGEDASSIENLSAGQNLTAMDDIKYMQGKILTALRTPRAFLNFEESAGDGKNLSLMDVRFTRTVNKIQQALLMELNKIAIIHLYLLGFTDELTNFKITMNNPSSQAEMLEIENMAKRITTAKDAVSDPGGGMPLFSMTWAWKHIFKMSDKEIQQNLEEIRLETALAAELQKTTQIIKKTGLFDPVDNIYGEPGAEYSEGQPNEGEDGGMGGAPGGGGGGGMPMGSGDLDFGDEGGEEETDMGAEGEMDMNSAANEDGANAMDNGGQDNTSGQDNSINASPNLGEMLTRVAKERIDEKKEEITRNATERNMRYSQLLTDRLLEKINTKKKTKVENVQMFDKTFFLNEELDKISKRLGEIKQNSGEDETIY